MKKFTDFGLNETLLEALSYMNFDEATEIQEKAIPAILEGKDLIGCAQTGTGKTAAFVLPTLNQVAEEQSDGVQVLILCPTRELAVQIEQQIQGIAYFTNASCYAVYGGGDGVSWEGEADALKGGADIIVATPGRLLAHIARGYVKFDTVKHLILDEADRMLDIGFYDDIIKIIKTLPDERQSLMFSATMASKIRQLAKQILNNPEEISVAISKPAEGVTQKVIMAHEEQKVAVVQHVLGDKDDFNSIIIFCSTKKKVERLARKLKQKGYSCQGISSDYEQEAREEALRDFRSGKTRIMVATDVMSRGIDIKGIDLVMNYDVPGDAEDYVHRIGRTARAKTKGMAVTLISQDDMFKFSKIERLIDRELDKDPPPESIGEGPQWRTAERRGKGRKPSSSNKKLDSSRPEKPRQGSKSLKPKEERKKEKSKNRLLYEALPNPKQ
ncbi:DEAD/DEAH box helicase [Schleiferiaceae bacterium]|nr:ATP-dependent RNA helicase [Flavobacteriales bacterium]MDC1021800.1 DEAD/DEAH box helicase [Schleiferiaceae bacterium]|tara:strand:+ start:1698 stop:3023 length:1326 start_codon:yes stop_codon:yes gene_type:complete